MLITATIDAAAIKAIQKAPEHMARYLGNGVHRGAEETARYAKEEAPKAFSALVNSINASKVGPLAWDVGAHVNYDTAVQTGTGPAVGKARYFPNPERLERYIGLRSGLRLAKAGTAKRFRQEDDRRYRAGALARFIFQHGTQPNPYLQRTHKAMAPRVLHLISESAAAGLQTLSEQSR